MKFRHQLLIILVLSIGCTRSYDLVSLEELNQAVAEKEVTIRFREGSVGRGTNFHMAADSARWIGFSGDHHAVPSPSVEYVQTKNSTRGRNHGMIFGAVGCAGLGIAGKGLYDATSENEFILSWGESAALGVIVGGFGGCICGSAMGATDQFNTPDSLLHSTDGASANETVHTSAVYKPRNDGK